mmetsp:Transcript_108131/g.272012  ORF Transcript_108131/g.272012 Transcript_108131/m.272012 type:complete len:308 (-) Transcript_108131:1655-2578(-)
MDYIKAANTTLHMEKVPDEGAAHVLDLADEVSTAGEAHLVVGHARDRLLGVGLIPGASEDVDLVAGLVQRPGELEKVRCRLACRDGLQGLPGEHRDLQRPPSHDAILVGLHAREHPTAVARRLGLQSCLNDAVHAPSLVAPRREELAPAARQPGGLAHVEAETSILHGHAQRGVVSELVCNREAHAAQLMHQRVRRPQVAETRRAQGAHLFDELLHRLRLLGHPHAVVCVDRGGDTLEPEAVNAVLRHPEVQARQQVPHDLRLREVEEPRAGRRGEALLAAGEVVDPQAVLHRGCSIVGDAEQHSQT